MASKRCRARKAEGAGPATNVMDVTYLSGVSTYTATTLGTRSRADMMTEASKELRRLRLTARSRDVERLPGQSELNGCSPMSRRWWPKAAAGCR